MAVTSKFDQVARINSTFAIFMRFLEHKLACCRLLFFVFVKQCRIAVAVSNYRILLCSTWGRSYDTGVFRSRRTSWEQVRDHEWYPLLSKEVWLMRQQGRPSVTKKGQLSIIPEDAYSLRKSSIKLKWVWESDYCRSEDLHWKAVGQEEVSTYILGSINLKRRIEQSREVTLWAQPRACKIRSETHQLLCMMFFKRYLYLTRICILWNDRPFNWRERKLSFIT